MPPPWGVSGRVLGDKSSPALAGDRPHYRPAGEPGGKPGHAMRVLCYRAISSGLGGSIQQGYQVTAYSWAKAQQDALQVMTRRIPPAQGDHRRLLRIPTNPFHALNEGQVV